MAGMSAKPGEIGRRRPIGRPATRESFGGCFIGSGLHRRRAECRSRAQKEWVERASRFLKAELKRADVTYEELARRLNAKGWSETKASIANKLARGAFTATFFLATLAEIGCETVRLEDV